MRRNITVFLLRTISLEYLSRVNASHDGVASDCELEYIPPPSPCTGLVQNPGSYESITLCRYRADAGRRFLFKLRYARVLIAPRMSIRHLVDIDTSDVPLSADTRPSQTVPPDRTIASAIFSRH